MKTVKGEITAYLSLVFILLVAFTGGIIESASVQNAKNYQRADMNRAAECVFAEYQKELLEEYDIFALDGSYETGMYDDNNIIDRLAYYGAGNMDQEILRLELLTDNGGQPFLEQISAYMTHRYGLDWAGELLEKADVWREQEEKSKAYVREEKTREEELAELLADNEGELPKENNPIEHVQMLKSTPLLSLVVPEEKNLSEKSIVLDGLASRRNLNRGYGDFSDVEKERDNVSSLLFGEYVLKHFSAASDEEGDGPVDYETEYILAGKASDRENLEAAAKKLLLLRFVPNYIYLQSDSEKRAEAQALAITLCSLLAVPAVTEAAFQMLLLSWAYGESVMDVRALLAGNRVSFVKTKESWQLGLSSLLTLGKEEPEDGADTEGGLAYKDYLRILLFLENPRSTAMRALDLIEQNLRIKCGQEYFHADQCVSKAEFSSICTFRRNVTYQFSTYFGYN